MNLDLEFLNSDPIFEVEEHHFSSVYSKPTHLLHQFWTLSSTSIPWIDSARLGSDEGSLSEGEGGGLEKLSFGVKRDEFQRIIEQRIKVKATKWMDRRTNSQKSFLPEGFCHFRDSWKLSIYRAFKINTIHTHSAPFRGMLLLKILFYVFA